jgi:hypothetical protein
MRWSCPASERADYLEFKAINTDHSIHEDHWCDTQVQYSRFSKTVKEYKRRGSLIRKAWEIASLAVPKIPGH